MLSTTLTFSVMRAEPALAAEVYDSQGYLCPEGTEYPAPEDIYCGPPAAPPAPGPAQIEGSTGLDDDGTESER